jgi:transcriptional regulator with XRE-family HTH domain
MNKPLSKRELLAYRADIKGSIFRQIREVFSRLKEKGLTQKELAERIDMDAGLLSRRLHGDYDLRLETLSDLARGLDCRIDVKLRPISEARAAAQPRLSVSDPVKKQDGQGIENAKNPFEKTAPSPPPPLGNPSPAGGLVFR